MSKAASDDEHAVSPPEIFAWISIISERCSADEISALIGMQPDRAWKIGDRRGKTAIIERLMAGSLTLASRTLVSEKFVLLPEDNVVTVHVAIYSEPESR
jgi:hypothetical protein